MNSGCVAVWALALALAPLLIACEKPPPNVVLIVIDTLRRDHVGFDGYDQPTSPNLDRLATESLVVLDAGANAPWTKPAIGTLFTSLMPAKHQAIHEQPQSRLAEGFLTLAEVFRDAGYRTGGFSENPNIHSKTGFAQGFDSFRDPVAWARPRETTVARAVDWLKQGQAANDSPFFLYLHFLDPHPPYRAPAKIRKRFAAGHHSEIPWARQGRVSQLKMNMDPRDLAPQDVAMLEALYDAEIHWVDGQIGALLSQLVEQSLFENTILLVTADHGEEFLEQGRLAHGPWLSGELLRIPLLLHVPGQSGRRVGNTGVSQLDVAPTLLELAKVPIPRSFEGRSFAGLVRGQTFPPRTVRAETHNAGTHLRSVREDPWKLIRDELAGTNRLYNLHSDPGEDQDLAGIHPEIVARLFEQLESVPAAGPTLLPGARGAPDRDLEQHLRDLGYLESEPDSKAKSK